MKNDTRCDVMWCAWCDENWVRPGQNIINLAVNVPNVSAAILASKNGQTATIFIFMKMNIELICYKLNIILYYSPLKFQYYVVLLRYEFKLFDVLNSKMRNWRHMRTTIRL